MAETEHALDRLTTSSRDFDSSKTRHYILWKRRSGKRLTFLYIWEKQDPIAHCTLEKWHNVHLLKKHFAINPSSERSIDAAPHSCCNVRYMQT